MINQYLHIERGMYKYLIFGNLIFYNIYHEVIIMIIFNIEKLLEKKNKSTYWLCQKMNITTRNLNRVIHGETTSISFKYLEDFCKYLDCDLPDLIELEKED